MPVNPLSAFLLRLRFGWLLTKCAFINYAYLLLYLFSERTCKQTVWTYDSSRFGPAAASKIEHADPLCYRRQVAAETVIENL